MSKKGDSGVFLIIGLVYLLLSCPVTIRAGAGISGAQGSLKAELAYMGLRLRFDGVIAWAKGRPSISVRYGRGRSVELPAIRPRGAAGRRLRAALPYLRAALSAGRVCNLKADMCIGLDDAARTAVAVGACRAALSCISAALAPYAACDLRAGADYQTPRFLLNARCIFSSAPGDIMFAAAKTALKKKRKEGAEWKSIPLRA